MKAIFRSCIDGLATYGAAHHSTSGSAESVQEMLLRAEAKPAEAPAIRIPPGAKGATIIRFDARSSPTLRPMNARPRTSQGETARLPAPSLPPTAPAGRLTRLRLVGAFIHARLRRRPRNRQTTLEWEALDDRTLRDLGLYRVGSDRFVIIRYYDD
ncbi:hypothetical protein [Aliidongia dinghuensis]|uniref:hypothetical protein n=1 Tax=Aliidongia dinghuensis TaxID=1867774 RepID=UPI001662C0F7|nr:hypothetical protein [Aliidongia dinghuensis]